MKKAKPTKTRGGRGGKKTVVEKPPVTKKRSRKPSHFIFLENDAEELLERLTVLRGIFRQQINDRLFESYYSDSAYPSLNEIEQRLARLFLDIEELPLRGFPKEFACLSQVIALWIFQILPINEDEFKDVAKLKMSNKILTLFKQEWDRRSQSPNRKTAALRDSYQSACKQAIIEAVILHEAGIRKHWLRPGTPMPAERWGSAEGKANWQTWIRAFLTGMHKSGELFRFHTDSPAKENFAGARAKSRDRFFSELYILTLNFMQPVLQSTARLLYCHYTRKPCPEPFKQQMFIDLIRKLHPEIYSPTPKPKSA